MAHKFVPPNVIKVDGVWQIEGKPRETLSIGAEYHPSNLPGKTVLVALIDMPPNGASPSHRHGGAAVVAVGISGTSLNQMNDSEPQAYGPGEFWYEAPGCHHQRSENFSGEESAKFLAVLIVDDEVITNENGERDFGGIFVLDKEVEAGEKKPSK